MAKRVGIAVGTFSLALGLLAVPLQVLAAPPSGPVPSVYRPLSSTALVPSITGLDRSVGRLTQSPTLGKFSMLVVDPVTEKPVFSDQVNKARIPASVTKNPYRCRHLEFIRSKFPTLHSHHPQWIGPISHWRR